MEHLFPLANHDDHLKVISLIRLKHLHSEFEYSDVIRHPGDEKASFSSFVANFWRQFKVRRAWNSVQFGIQFSALAWN